MIFLDTSVLVAYIVNKDSNHEKAVRLIDDIIAGKYGSTVTSDYVFDETVTVVLVRTKSLESAITSGQLIKESMDILSVNDIVFENAWKLFKNQESARFSFTDCTILSLISANHIENLATFDKELGGANFYQTIR